MSDAAPSSRLSSSKTRLPEGRVVVERDLLVPRPRCVEQRLRADAVAAPRASCRAGSWASRRVNAQSARRIPPRATSRRLRPARRTLEPWPARPRPKRSCCAPSGSARPTGSCTSTRRPGPRRRGRQGRPQDEVALRRPPGAVLPRRAHPPPGARRARDGHGSLARPLARRDPPGPVPPQVGLIGLEAMLRLFTEQEANERAFTALTRFLDALDAAPPQAGSRAALDPVVLSFQLKLLWVSGYAPHLDTCVECGSEEPLVGFVASAGGGACEGCDPGGIALSPEGVHGMRVLLHSPIAAAAGAGLGDRARRETLAVVTASYEHHGGFRLKTCSPCGLDGGSRRRSVRITCVPGLRCRAARVCGDRSSASGRQPPRLRRLHLLLPRGQWLSRAATSALVPITNAKPGFDCAGAVDRARPQLGG